MGILNAIDNFFSDIHGAFIVGRTNDALKKLQKELDKLPEGATISRPKPTMPVPEEAEPINKGPVKTFSEKVPEPEEVVEEILQPEEKQPEAVIVEEQPVQQEEAKQPEPEPAKEETNKPKPEKKPEQDTKKPEKQKKPKQEKKPDPVQEETKKPEQQPIAQEAKQPEPEPVQEQPEQKPEVEPEKKPDPVKTQHQESLNMQMGDIDDVLNKYRRSRKVSPPGGGVGSAIKK